MSPVRSVTYVAGCSRSGATRVRGLSASLSMREVVMGASDINLKFHIGGSAPHPNPLPACGEREWRRDALPKAGAHR
jgi:hypothetical protein